MILDSQESCYESTRKKFWETLLKKHHHQHEKRRNILPIVRSFGESGQKKSDPHSIDKTGKDLRLMAILAQFPHYIRNYKPYVEKSLGIYNISGSNL